MRRGRLGGSRWRVRRGGAGKKGSDRRVYEKDWEVGN